MWNDTFVFLIARNRNLSIKTIKDTEAGLYFGKSAIEIGLADGIATFNELINKGDKTMTEQKAQTIEKYRAEVLEIGRLCNISKMPEKLLEFVEQGISVEQAREILISTLAERTTKAEIFSALPQDSSENLMMKAAKARCNI